MKGPWPPWCDRPTPEVHADLRTALIDLFGLDDGCSDTAIVLTALQHALASQPRRAPHRPDDRSMR